MWSVAYGPRLVRTVSHLRFRQLSNRISHVVRRRWWRTTGRQWAPGILYPARDLVPLWTGLTDIYDDKTPEVAQACNIARQVIAGKFTFLNQTVQFSDEDWNRSELPQLWRYHLHYFGCIRELLIFDRACNVGECYAAFRRLVLSWNASNRKMTGDGWHPYTLSLRVVNWLHAWCAWRPRIMADAAFCPEFLGSLHAQARALFQQLEMDVRGNHLLENLRALLWLGLAFDGPETKRWFDVALQHLQNETREQILEDGGHFERTPGYHVVVLRDYLEIALLLERNAGKCPHWLRNAIRRQAGFLQQIRPPGGRLPLLKDTAYDAIPNPAEVQNIAASWLDEPGVRAIDKPGLEMFLVLGAAKSRKLDGWPAPKQILGASMLPGTGYCILRGEAEFAIIDIGKPCPDYLPAHAHADTFNLEYYVDGFPIVVDSGVYQYKSGEWRDFFRSTRAHNTLEIGSANSSEVWGSFRVGRRATVTVTNWQAREAGSALVARHDGYKYLVGQPIHERVVIWERGKFLLVLDHVMGAGIQSLQSYIHFHPEIEPMEEGLGRWRIPAQTNPVWLVQIGSATAAWRRGCVECPRNGWYSERFGEMTPNTVLSFGKTSPLPQAFGYLLSRFRDISVTTVNNLDKITIYVVGDDWKMTYDISAGQVSGFR